jgi:excinuclease UvrABC ATPase subunit
MPAELNRMTNGLLAELNGRLTPLLDVGLSYLTLDRAGASLSTGERQRIELTSTVRASTTGMLYVLDEPSVGLHPANVQGLRKTITALAGNGNTVVVVEHERELIRSADWVIELGPRAGASGGTVIAQGTPGQLETDPRSIMEPFLAGAAAVPRDRPARAGPGGQITIEIGDLPVRIDGLTVADVLGLSVHDALDRSSDRAPVAAALWPVDEVGLGYLRLGEPTPSLSGGESQRLRIASRLRSSQRGALYVLDEPSTGLHPLDVATLVGVFDRLLEAGLPSSSSTTTWTCSRQPTTSSTWARAAARTAGTSSRPGHRKTSRAPRAARPGHGWPSTWTCPRPASPVSRLTATLTCRRSNDPCREPSGQPLGKPEGSTPCWSCCTWMTASRCR